MAKLGCTRGTVTLAVIVSSTVLRLPLDSALWMTCCLVMSDPQGSTGSVRTRWALGDCRCVGARMVETQAPSGELESGTQARTLSGCCCGPATPVCDVSHWAVYTLGYGAESLRPGLLGFNLLVGDTPGNKPSRSFRMVRSALEVVDPNGT